MQHYVYMMAWPIYCKIKEEPIHPKGTSQCIYISLNNLFTIRCIGVHKGTVKKSD